MACAIVVFMGFAINQFCFVLDKLILQFMWKEIDNLSFGYTLVLPLDLSIFLVPAWFLPSIYHISAHYWSSTILNITLHLYILLFTPFRFGLLDPFHVLLNIPTDVHTDKAATDIAWDRSIVIFPWHAGL